MEPRAEMSWRVVEENELSMGFPESGYLCEKALARWPQKLRWVFIETGGVRTRIPPSQRDTRRLVYWHDVPRTLAICRTILARKDRARVDGEGAGRLLPSMTRKVSRRFIRQRTAATGRTATTMGRVFSPPLSPRDSQNSLRPHARKAHRKVEMRRLVAAR